MANNVDVEQVVVGQGTPTAVKTVASREYNGAQYQEVLTGLVTGPFDYVALTYVAAGNGVGEIETATYKTDGAAGTTVATITLAYNVDNKISSITKT
jgi:hypothetical protein